MLCATNEEVLLEVGGELWIGDGVGGVYGGGEGLRNPTGR